MLRLPGSMGRRKFIVIVLMAVFFASVSVVILALDRFSVVDGPYLDIGSACSTDLGMGELGETLTQTFSFQNVGTKPAKFTLKGSCRCTTLEPTMGEIQPGQKQVVTVGVNLRRRGKTEIVVVDINSNDTAHPVISKRFVAKCRTPVIVQPSAIAFGSVGMGKTQEAKVYVADSDEKPVSDPAAVIATTASDNLRIEKGKDSNGKVFVKVTLLSARTKGFINEEVRIRLAGGAEDVGVPVTGRIVGELVVSPSTIIAVKDEETGLIKDAHIVVRTTNGNPLGNMKLVECPKGIDIVDCSPNSLDRKKLVVKFARAVSLPARIAVAFDRAAETAQLEVISRFSNESDGSPYSKKEE
jgi:hypothetical protein